MDQNQLFKQELLDLLENLNELGREHTEYLVSLTQVVDPELPFDQRLPLLSRMFAEVPSFLESSMVTPTMLANLPPEAVAVRLLVDLRKIKKILDNLTFSQLLHLSTSAPPGSTINFQYALLLQLRYVFSTWSHSMTNQIVQEMKPTPIHLEREVLLRLDPSVAPEVVPLLIKILKSESGTDLMSFKLWMQNLLDIDLIILTNLLQFEPAILTELKRRLSRPSRKRARSETDFVGGEKMTMVMPGSVGMASPVARVNSPMQVNSTSNQFVIKVLDKGQPPAMIVYQRIIKPCPSVILLPSVPNPHNDLFVEASLVANVGSTTGTTNSLQSLDGTKMISITPGQVATFKKLKILHTTQQLGTLLRIKFQLKRATEGVFIDVDGVYALSNPIEVFSHSHYLKEKISSPTPPIVTEVLPTSGSPSGGTRIAILGDNFVESAKLKVKIGNIIMTPVFHESRTLICTTPPGASGSTVTISVSNDGVDFSSSIYFSYE